MVNMRVSLVGDGVVDDDGWTHGPPALGIHASTWLYAAGVLDEEVLAAVAMVPMLKLLPSREYCSDLVTPERVPVCVCFKVEIPEYALRPPPVALNLVASSSRYVNVCVYYFFWINFLLYVFCVGCFCFAWHHLETLLFQKPSPASATSAFLASESQSFKRTHTHSYIIVHIQMWIYSHSLHLFI